MNQQEKKKRARRLRILIQAASWGLFAWLLGRAAGPEALSRVPPDIFLRLDPLAAVAVPIAAREFIAALIPGLLLLAVATVFGRVFCGYVCPMGATLDAAGWLLRFCQPPRPAEKPGSPYRYIKYMVLIAALAAAAFGVSLIFWAAPIPLVTRLYAEGLYPLLLLGLDHIRPALEALGLIGQYAAIKTRAFDGGYIIAFFGFLIILEKIRPRFWCGVLCPAGALLGLMSRRPAWRRRVERCVGCGRCAKQCPTQAISDDGRQTCFSECLTCRACQDICPAGGVKFSFAPAAESLQADGLAFPRRAFLKAGVGGVGLACVHTLPQAWLLRRAGGLGVVRPPGAILESDFLTKCLRCGECVKACPTNGLRLQGLERGLYEFSSPHLAARRGPCEPECRACGQVCPTRAIRPLPLAEKKWAKMGTAVVVKDTCLAWAEDRRCVVCQEVCPYGAVDLVREDGLEVPVPQVNAARCYGCGYCEYHCPVAAPAIVVTAQGALRLNGGDTIREAQALGLDLDPDRPRTEEALPDDELPPGFIL
ncbi:MAG: 4Fe-4S dicluster domain-containing protein [Candidatus Adiutrix sp.]|nr:4Fe-4S dicluster domain-containing protein [Candidatus Adiutrix sp.]